VLIGFLSHPVLNLSTGGYGCAFPACLQPGMIEFHFGGGEKIDLFFAIGKYIKKGE
jgi:hypothetical protein